MQVVQSGFEGMITGIGAIPGEAAPSLVLAVLRRPLVPGGDTRPIVVLAGVFVIGCVTGAALDGGSVGRRGAFDTA